MTSTSDIQSLVERDRGMMLELEKMKEERRRIIESLTKDDKMINKNNSNYINSENSKKSDNNTNQKQSNFDMIRSE